MQEAQYKTATNYYEDVLNLLSNQFPRFLEERTKLLFVAHAFEDKLPLLDVLLKKRMLSAIVLKRSSSQAQPSIARTLSDMAREHDIPCIQSTGNDGKTLPTLYSPEKKVVINHGSYEIPTDDYCVQNNVVGMTEHTLNVEKRFRAVNQNNIIAFKSAAKIDSKQRSDREISFSIAKEIMSNNEQIGKSITSSNTDNVLLLIGYGVMGHFIAQELKRLNCTSDIIIDDISDKKKVFAIQDGFTVSKNINDILPVADSIILSTDVIKGEAPVFTPKQLALLKEGVSLFSVTSADDELQQGQLIKSGIIRKETMEGKHGIYTGPTGKRFFLMADGKPANAYMADGGVKEAMMLVEAAVLAGAFELAQNPRNCSATLSNEAEELVAQPWLKHYSQALSQYSALCAS